MVCCCMDIRGYKDYELFSHLAINFSKSKLGSLGSLTTSEWNRRVSCRFAVPPGVIRAGKGTRLTIRVVCRLLLPLPRSLGLRNQIFPAVDCVLEVVLVSHGLEGAAVVPAIEDAGEQRTVPDDLHAHPRY